MKNSQMGINKNHQRSLSTEKWFLAFLCLVIIFSWNLQDGFSFTMIRLNLEEVTNYTLEDRDQDNKMDGDVVLLTLFHSETQSIKKVYTFMVEEFLTDENTNLKDGLSVGQLVTITNPRQNPMLHLINDHSGDKFVAFLRRETKYNPDGSLRWDNFIMQSMMMAPLMEKVEPDGNVQTTLLNPWHKGPTLPPNALGFQTVQGLVMPRENFGDFKSRLQNNLDQLKKN